MSSVEARLKNLEDAFRYLSSQLDAAFPTMGLGGESDVMDATLREIRDLTAEQQLRGETESAELFRRIVPKLDASVGKRNETFYPRDLLRPTIERYSGIHAVERWMKDFYLGRGFDLPIIASFAKQLRETFIRKARENPVEEPPTTAKEGVVFRHRMGLWFRMTIEHRTGERHQVDVGWEDANKFGFDLQWPTILITTEVEWEPRPIGPHRRIELLRYDDLTRVFRQLAKTVGIELPFQHTSHFKPGPIDNPVAVVGFGKKALNWSVHGEVLINNSTIGTPHWVRIPYAGLHELHMLHPDHPISQKVTDDDG